MRLAGMDGKNLPYSEGVTRYLMMLWMGLGFYIPILSLVMILRSAWRCWKEEPQPWDDGVAYTAKPFRLRYAASLILTVLLVLIVGEAVNSWSQLPPNRGDLRNIWTLAAGPIWMKTASGRKSRRMAARSSPWKT